MKKILFAIGLLLLAACSGGLKGRDIDYRGNGSTVVAVAKPEWSDATFATLKEADSNWAFGSCVGIYYDETKNQTYLATAFHIIKGNVKYVKQTEGIGKLFRIVKEYSHPTKDIGFLVVDGRLPTIPVYKGIPSSDYDITLGYIEGRFNGKAPLVGKAVPGQSGGGVYSNTKGLYGVVSTTGEAVAIWSAIVDLKLDNVIRPN